MQTPPDMHMLVPCPQDALQQEVELNFLLCQQIHKFMIAMPNTAVVNINHGNSTFPKYSKGSHSHTTSAIGNCS